MSETRLKIHSDAWELVIEQDRARFGPLLRKIKDAYDAQMEDGSPIAQAISPESPALELSPADPGSPPDAKIDSGLKLENEGGARAEMLNENRVLKALVDRMYIELEAGVKRENLWKDKVDRLKARMDSLNSLRLTTAATPVTPVMRTAPAVNRGIPRAMPPRGYTDASQDEGVYDDSTINTAGFGMSQSSLQTSVPADSMGISDAQSARSSDSGMLSQRPSKEIVRPDHVPKLQLSMMNGLDDDEDDDEFEDLLADL